MVFSFPTDFAPTKRIAIIAITVGIIAGFGALLFYEGLKWAVAFFFGYLLQYVYPQEGQSLGTISQWTDPHSLVLLIPILILGSLISGLLIAKLAPEAEGDGTDAAFKAFHTTGRIRKRIPLLKAITAILTISTGGSAGREGPAAQIAGGFGSMVADVMGLSPKERRIALTTGIGAGIGTIFKAPLGGAVLAAEVLYTRDFESEAIIPAFLASVIGYSIFGFFEGYSPVFSLNPISWTVVQIPLFLILGAFCAAFGLIFIYVYYWSSDWFTAIFTRHNLPPYLKPVSGAILLGILVLVLTLISPEAEMLGLAGMGTGYGFDQLMLYSLLPFAVILFLPFIKIITTSLTLGSGGSGGVFAPGLTIGAAVGAALGTILHLLVPAIVPVETIPVFVVVGMISLFGAIAKSPIAVLIMVVEMVGSITILIPAMASVAVSYLLTGDSGIFKDQVPTKAQSGAHRGEYDRVTLEGILVRDAMTPADNVLTISPDDDPVKVVDLMTYTRHTGFPIIDDGRLVGIITNRDVSALRIAEKTCPSIRAVMISPPFVIHPDDTLEAALEVMIGHDFDHLPVVRQETPDTLAGFLTRTDILRTYVQASHLVTCEKEEPENQIKTRQ